MLLATVNGLITSGFHKTSCTQPFLTISSISDYTNFSLSIADLLLLISTELEVVENGKLLPNSITLNTYMYLLAFIELY